MLPAAILVLSCGGQQATAVAEHHTIEIRDFAFQPDTVQVAAGDTVVWINRDVVPHTATSDVWVSGALERDGTWDLVVAGPDTIDYVCTLHPAMTGTLIIADRSGGVSRSGSTGGMYVADAK